VGQGPSTQQYNYYDDDGYTAAESLSPQDLREGPGFGELQERASLGWSASADLGLLVVRLVLGGVFLAHGAQKLFGVLGGPGPDGFARMLADLGFEQTELLAQITGGTEVLAGALLVLGLFTPLAAAGILGVMGSAVVLHAGNGFFLPNGVEYEAVLAAVAFGLMFAGPGRVALDRGRAWSRRPGVFGVIGLVLAVVAAAVVLLVLR
jgi:putative oxidoreductase